MVNVNNIKAEIARKNLTLEKVADLIGVSKNTMTTRMQTGVWWTDELERLAKVLELENPGKIFFD